MTNMIAVRDAVHAFETELRTLEERCVAAGAYMPGLATRLRIYADEMADKYPDDTNGGKRL